MREPPHRPHILLSLLKNPNLIHHARFAEFVDPHAQVDDGRVGDGAEEVAAGVDDDADLAGGGGVPVAVLDQVLVDDGVEALGWERQDMVEVAERKMETFTNRKP